MRKKSPTYAIHIRWGGFDLNITGKRAILMCVTLFAVLVGARIFGTKLLDLF